MSQPDRGDRDEVLRKEERTMKERGEGAMVYLPKSELEEFKFKPGDQVNVEYVIRDGSVRLRMEADTPGGFNKEELLEFAMNQDWDRSGGSESGDIWAYSFKDSTGEVRIEVDSEVRAGDDVLDNVIVEGPAITLSEDLDQLSDLTEIAQQDAACRVEIRDNDGIWDQYQAFDHGKEAPDRDVIRQLVRKTDTVTARLVATRPSILTSLDEIQELVETVRTRSLTD